MTIYYQDDSVTLHHSRWEDVLPSLPDGSVDHVITDPPYSEKTHKSVRSRRMSANDRGGRYGADVRRVVNLGFDHLTDEERAAAAVEFARLAQRWVLTFSDVETCHLWREDLEAAGLDYVRTLAWHRLGGAPQFSGDRPGVAFEVITVAHPKGRKRWNSGGKRGHYSHAIVLDRGHEKVRVHATQKPEPLMAELIGDFTDAGDLILDAYAGSGTTGVVAKRAGRRAILIEQDERNCESIATRLEKVEPVLTEHIEDEALLPHPRHRGDRVTDLDLTDAVEAAARAWFDRGQAGRMDAGRFNDDGTHIRWEQITDMDRRAYRELVSPIVHAAAPHIAEQVSAA